jgi:hypothetical protein
MDLSGRVFGSLNVHGRDFVHAKSFSLYGGREEDEEKMEPKEPSSTCLCRIGDSTLQHSPYQLQWI